jgi:transcriptional regulator with XRE-family HTH domain
VQAAGENLLGNYLKDRRTKLDPAAFGLALTRRRTPGLRREEVAQRANVSATWYTWLEQGRGGAPSASVLERIARALMLTEVEREHLFLIALGRPPAVRYQAADGVTPRLQRVLDSLELSPGIVKTSTWDIVAWNRAAAVVLADYGALAQPDWDSAARFVVAAFRADAARAGAAANVQRLVDELSRLSPEFEAMWRDNDVRSYGEGSKSIRHPLVGLIALEYSSFAVDGRPDLGMVIFTPATPADAERVSSLIRSRPRTAR